MIVFIIFERSAILKKIIITLKLVILNFANYILIKYIFLFLNILTTIDKNGFKIFQSPIFGSIYTVSWGPRLAVAQPWIRNNKAPKWENYKMSCNQLPNFRIGRYRIQWPSSLPALRQTSSTNTSPISAVSRDTTLPWNTQFNFYVLRTLYERSYNNITIAKWIIYQPWRMAFLFTK